LRSLFSQPVEEAFLFCDDISLVRQVAGRLDGRARAVAGGRDARGAGGPTVRVADGAKGSHEGVLAAALRRLAADGLANPDGDR